MQATVSAFNSGGPRCRSQATISIDLRIGIIQHNEDGQYILLFRRKHVISEGGKSSNANAMHIQ